jgi:signal transduction histidine kinase
MLARAARHEAHLGLIRSLGLRSYLCVSLVISGKPTGVLTFATADSGRGFTRADLALTEDLSRRTAVAIENSDLYQALREEDRRKTEFLALLAHEIRNPLAPLRNGLEVLRVSAGEPQCFEQTRAMMERQLAHLVRLVDDLLDVSRGKIELRKERVPLADVVASTLETCHPMFKESEDELKVTLSEEPVYEDADRIRLAQAICNWSITPPSIASRAVPSGSPPGDKGTRRSSASRTRASASRPQCCTRSSSFSPGWTGRWSSRRAGSASA